MGVDAFDETAASCRLAWQYNFLLFVCFSSLRSGQIHCGGFYSDPWNHSCSITWPGRAAAYGSKLSFCTRAGDSLCCFFLELLLEFSRSWSIILATQQITISLSTPVTFLWHVNDRCFSKRFTCVSSFFPQLLLVVNVVCIFKIVILFSLP